MCGVHFFCGDVWMLRNLAHIFVATKHTNNTTMSYAKPTIDQAHDYAKQLNGAAFVEALEATKMFRDDITFREDEFGTIIVHAITKRGEMHSWVGQKHSDGHIFWSIISAMSLNNGRKRSENYRIGLEVKVQRAMYAANH